MKTKIKSALLGLTLIMSASSAMASGVGTIGSAGGSSEGDKTIICGVSVDSVTTAVAGVDTYRLKEDYESIGAKVKICTYGNGYAVVAKLTNGSVEALLNLNK